MSVKRPINFREPIVVVPTFFAVLVIVLFLLNYTNLLSTTYDSLIDTFESQKEEPRVLDLVDYDRRMLMLATASSTIEYIPATTTATSTATTTVKAPLWPVKAAYPNVDAILPFKRVVAYYGNFLSTKMGVLGEYPTEQMLEMFRAEIKKMGRSRSDYASDAGG